MAKEAMVAKITAMTMTMPMLDAWGKARNKELRNEKRGMSLGSTYVSAHARGGE